MSNKQQDLFNAVKAGFATLLSSPTPGNPAYTSNVGQKINEWQMTAIDAANDSSLLPCVCLSDPREVNLGAPNGNERSSTRQFAVEFEAALFLAETDQTATAARQAKTDAYAMIGLNQTWGGLADRTEPGEAQFLSQKEGNRITGVLIKFTVKINRKTWKA